MISKHKIVFFFLCALPLFSLAQENSPYSRYGVGNVVPSGNIANRGMGGISAGVSDPTTVNTVNPASYGNLIYTTLDVGVEYDGRNLKSKEPIGNFKSNNGIISYLQIGFPLLYGNKRAIKNKTAWAITFGLKPISKINYKVQSSGRNSADSTETLMEGNGGVNEAFVGTALKIKNFSIGFNTGYLFGEKDYSTKLLFNNDTVSYSNANYSSESRFGGVFLNAGIQYAFDLKKDGKKNGELRIGAYGDLKRQYSASRDDLRETFVYDANGGAVRVDSVSEVKDQKGTVQMPATFGVGFSLQKQHILFGIDYETTQWDDYRFFGQKDLVKNSWLAKAGLLYYPGSGTGYFNYVKYRAGVTFGTDYINVDSDLPFYTASIGAALPLKLKHSFYDHQFSVMNVAFEFGNRGNKNNNITENIYKVSLGFSLSDIWFIRQKYE
jgi:hypothetical protein